MLKCLIAVWIIVSHHLFTLYAGLIKYIRTCTASACRYTKLVIINTFTLHLVYLSKQRFMEERLFVKKSLNIPLQAEFIR